MAICPKVLNLYRAALFLPVRPVYLTHVFATTTVSHTPIPDYIHLRATAAVIVTFFCCLRLLVVDDFVLLQSTNGFCYEVSLVECEEN
jgi:hypothetical protein